MVTVTVELFTQGPGVVYVMLYVFKVLPDRLISPVAVLTNTNPAGDEVNVPPAVPVIVGTGFVPVAQKVEEE